MKVSWADKSTVVSTEAELLAIESEIEGTRQPTMLFLESDNGTALVFGVGHQESVMTFFEQDGRSFHSLGDPHRNGHIVFLSRDQLDDFMCEMAIPSGLAKSAAAEYLRTEQRPGGVVWEADW